VAFKFFDIYGCAATKRSVWRFLVFPIFNFAHYATLLCDDDRM